MAVWDDHGVEGVPNREALRGSYQICNFPLDIVHQLADIVTDIGAHSNCLADLQFCLHTEMNPHASSIEHFSVILLLKPSTALRSPLDVVELEYYITRHDRRDSVGRI